MKNKALFLDRDGIINVERNYVHRIEDFEFIEGIFDILSCFQVLGYLLIIITNQAGIGRGYYTEQQFHILNNWMLDQFTNRGIIISNVYFCPDHPKFGQGKYKNDSYFRKPNPGMILQAKEEFNLDLSKCILVGDKISDIMAGLNAGILKNILISSNKSDNIEWITIPDIKKLINFAVRQC